MRNHYCLGAALLAAALAAWGAAPPPPDGPRTPPGAADALPAEDSAPLPAVRAVRARLVAKARAVAALLAGDCRLLEAAAHFRDLDAVEPRVLAAAHPGVYAGSTEAERYCRAVLFWADNAARSRAPETGVAALRRLGDELEGHRLCGTLELPPPAGAAAGAVSPR